MTGGSAWLASRLTLLPHFPEAAAAGASRVGIHLAQVGQVSAVAVVGSTVVISLPATAVAMAAQGKSWGSAGEGKQWHHIVEQTPGFVHPMGSDRFSHPDRASVIEYAII